VRAWLKTSLHITCMHAQDLKRLDPAREKRKPRTLRFRLFARCSSLPERLKQQQLPPGKNACMQITVWRGDGVDGALHCTFQEPSWSERERSGRPGGTRNGRVFCWVSLLRLRVGFGWVSIGGEGAGQGCCQICQGIVPAGCRVRKSRQGACKLPPAAAAPQDFSVKRSIIRMDAQ
jgi:hypothetical protein